MTHTTTAARTPGGPPPDLSGGAVRLAGLRKTFDGTVAVDGLDLHIAPGEVVALLGPNGAGKSTTIDMLLGLLPPERGTVSIFGEQPAAACGGGRVGAMLQSGGLLPDLTVREEIDLVRALYPRPARTAAVLERAGIGALAGRRTDRLSGGERQRVRFALALVPDPDLLVLDEPTVAMDVAARRAFWSALRAWAAAGRTVLFATHYLTEADDVADRVVLLRSGRVVADGPPARIKALASGRTIRATVPGVGAAGVAGLPALRALPGVAEASVQGETVVLRCPDSDTTLRALLAGWPAARDVEVDAAGLEEAFLSLTAEPTGPTDLGGPTGPTLLTTTTTTRTDRENEQVPS
jgi:ABC-2 type transport system ATP-binding protein